MSGKPGAARLSSIASLASLACGNVESGGCETDTECKGERICVSRACVAPDAGAGQAGAPNEPETCGSSGFCTATAALYDGDLDGLAGADRRCDAEFPGSHFYRSSCDSQRAFRSLSGFAELEFGTCWNCDDWTRNDSGPYDPQEIDCPTGYETVGALVPPLPSGSSAGSWRVCEALDKPLMCCIP